MIDFPEDIQKRAKQIVLMLFDVDGVMTDGRIILSESGEETKAFLARDGSRIKLAQQSGLSVGLISGRESKAVNVRAEELGIQHVYQNIQDKLVPFDEIKTMRGLADREIAFVGDDLLDIPLIQRAGLGLAVADASPEVREVADFVLSRSGGNGAVSEAIEIVLKSQGKWSNIVLAYRRCS